MRDLFFNNLMRGCERSMYYVSTRNKNQRMPAAQAIAQGLAADGGLLTPEVFPKLSQNALESMKEMSYQQRAVYCDGHLPG